MADLCLSFQKHPDSVPVARVVGGANDKATVFVNTRPDHPDGRRRPAPVVDFTQSLRGLGTPRVRAELARQLHHALERGGEPDNLALRGLYNEAVTSPQARRRLDIGDGVLSVLPSATGRSTVFLSARSGAVKSTWCRDWLKEWKRLNPDGQLHLFSLKDKDPALDDLDPGRVCLEELPDLVADPEAFKVTEMFDEGDAVVFDDCDSHPDKKVQKAIDAVRDATLTLGRSHRIYVCVTNHLGAAHGQTKASLRESTGMTIWPGRSAPLQVLYLLKNYANLDKEQITAIRKSTSRWVHVTLENPAVKVSEHSIEIL